mmetsp:Transcript_267/g.873  ORF Transcript_267/g.873 Transcript_267/m.873 type:complete len:251 (+) Transcript_267:211-963(+)
MSCVSCTSSGSYPTFANPLLPVLAVNPMYAFPSVSKIFAMSRSSTATWNTYRSMSSRNTWISPGNSFRMLYSASESCFGLNAGMYVIRTSVSSFVAPEVSVSSKLASSSSMTFTTLLASPSSPNPVVATGGDCRQAWNANGVSGSTQVMSRLSFTLTLALTRDAYPNSNPVRSSVLNFVSWLPCNLRRSASAVTMSVVEIFPLPCFSVVNPLVYRIFTVCSWKSAIVGTEGVLPKCAPFSSSECSALSSG